MAGCGQDAFMFIRRSTAGLRPQTQGSVKRTWPDGATFLQAGTSEPVRLSVVSMRASCVTDCWREFCLVQEEFSSSKWPTSRRAIHRYNVKAGSPKIRARVVTLWNLKGLDGAAGN